MALLVKHWKY